jgi:hypothetical protein
VEKARTRHFPFAFFPVASSPAVDQAADADIAIYLLASTCLNDKRSRRARAFTASAVRLKLIAISAGVRPAMSIALNCSSSSGIQGFKRKRCEPVIWS